MLKLRSLLFAAVLLTITGCMIRPIGYGGPEGHHDNGRGHQEGKGEGKGNDRGHEGDHD